MSVNEASFHRIKAAQRDLIKRAGGIERAVEITDFSKSQVGRWNNPLEPEMMPISAVLALEADTGEPLVTAVMAEANGRRLTDPAAERAAEVNVMASHAELMRRMAEVANAMAVAIADGKVTPTEAQTVDRVLSEVQHATSDMRSGLATIKAQGGVQASLRVVGEGE